VKNAGEGSPILNSRSGRRSELLKLVARDYSVFRFISQVISGAQNEKCNSEFSRAGVNRTDHPAIVIREGIKVKIPAPSASLRAGPISQKPRDEDGAPSGILL
jgi:hypothetical protein